MWQVKALLIPASGGREIEPTKRQPKILIFLLSIFSWVTTSIAWLLKQIVWAKSFCCMHSKDTIQKIRNKYRIPRKGTARLQSQFLHSCFCERFLYILWSVSLFFCRKRGGPNVGIYTDRLHTHECGNWDWGRAQFLFWNYINSNFVAVYQSTLGYLIVPVVGV